MSRRRRSSAEIANPFIRAMNSIRSKELDVFYATIEAQFTMDDVVAWLFPEDVIRKLKDAYPLAVSSYHTNFTLASFPLPSGAKVHLSLDLDCVKMQCPMSGKDTIQDHKAAPAIMGLLEATCMVHNQFNKVREVIDWFGEHHVTIGAAVYYWPTIKSLLPSEHPVHKASGERYCAVNGIAEIIPLLRETATIMAGAYLCPLVNKTRGNNLQVTCADKYAQPFKVL